MQIRDYESGRDLSDIDVILSREEVEELSAYLHRLLADPGLRSVQLSRINGLGFAAEFSVTLSPPQ